MDSRNAEVVDEIGIHTASFAASAPAMYSASIVDVATVFGL